MGIACTPAITVIWKSPHSYFHCNICREFDFTGILQGFPALDVGKPCNDWPDALDHLAIGLVTNKGTKLEKISEILLLSLGLSYRIVASTNTCYYSENQIFYSLE